MKIQGQPHVMALTTASPAGQPVSVGSSSALAPDQVALGGPSASSPSSMQRVFDRGTEIPAREMWSVPIQDVRDNPHGGGFLPATPVMAPDGSCYVGTHRGEVIALDASGGVRWKHDLGSTSAYNDPVVAWDGALVFTNEYDRRIFCLDADGNTRFDVQLPEAAHTRPLVDVDGRLVVSGARQLHVLKADGSLSWSSDLPALYCGFQTRPDATILVHGTGARLDDPVILQCLSPEGQESWRYVCTDRPGGLPATGPHNETVLTEGTTVRVLDAQGTLVGSADLGSRLGEVVVDPQGRALVGTLDGRVVAIDLSSLPTPPRAQVPTTLPMDPLQAPPPPPPPAPLRTLWTCPVDDSVKGHLVVGPQNTIYCNTAGRLHAISPDGHLDWTSPLAQSGRVETTVAPDGTIFAEEDSRVLQIFDSEGKHRGTIQGDYLAASPTTFQAGATALCDFDRVRLVGPGSWDDVIRDLPPASTTPPGHIERVGDWVIINGVRVPVQKRAAG